jgi:hypothetical protein
MGVKPEQVLEEQGIAADCGVKNADVQQPFESKQE